MVFALVGNQNCGKTTLFNALTGSNQHVGNFPGVTVDQKMGEIRDEKGCSVVDLPGIYSLRPYTQEEIVSRDFIINQKPDGIINIVDATNIERNLYLTLQLLELRVPMVLALNMMDEVRANGGSIDVRKMSQALGIPVIPITAAKGEGVSELVDQALTVARGKVLPKVTDFCSDDSAVTPLYSRRGAPHRGPCRPYRRSRPVLRRQAHRGRRRSGRDQLKPGLKTKREPAGQQTVIGPDGDMKTGLWTATSNAALGGYAGTGLIGNVVSPPPG